MAYSATPADNGGAAVLPISYVLPIAADVPQDRALTTYLIRLGRHLDEVIVVDGSTDPVFACHATAWGGHVQHLRPSGVTSNGKVAGVMTGVCAARNECVVIADDDVRYRRAEMARLAELLRDDDVVRPQNWFKPLPWHARLDHARSLIARSLGGDWPGTLGVRRSTLLRAGGYSGEVLFENFELVQTIRSVGGSELVAFDLFVARRPPSFGHFRKQRVRQAYDEWARPLWLVTELAILPLALTLVGRKKLTALLVMAICSVALAEAGRRKGGARAAFSVSTILLAPAWLCERAVTSWLAVGARLVFGGVRYRSGQLKLAATARRKLRMAEGGP